MTSNDHDGPYARDCACGAVLLSEQDLAAGQCSQCRPAPRFDLDDIRQLAQWEQLCYDLQAERANKAPEMHEAARSVVLATFVDVAPDGWRQYPHGEFVISAAHSDRARILFDHATGRLLLALEYEGEEADHA